MKYCILLALLNLYVSSAFIFGASRDELKKEIIDLSRSVNRGLSSTPEQDAQILSLFEKLERMNPTRKTLKSDLVNGVWSLEYTTSALILGKGGFGKRVGPVLQTIDTKALSAENSEVVDYFGIKVPSKVTAELSPQNDRLTNVQFKRFSFGPFGFDAPEQFKGYLDITYLDQDLRLTRGDRGNIFVLTRT